MLTCAPALKNARSASSRSIQVDMPNRRALRMMMRLSLRRNTMSKTLACSARGSNFTTRPSSARLIEYRFDKRQTGSLNNNGLSIADSGNQ